MKGLCAQLLPLETTGGVVVAYRSVRALLEVARGSSRGQRSNRGCVAPTHRAGERVVTPTQQEVLVGPRFLTASHILAVSGRFVILPALCPCAAERRATARAIVIARCELLLHVSVLQVSDDVAHPGKKPSPGLLIHGSYGHLPSVPPLWMQ